MNKFSYVHLTKSQNSCMDPWSKRQRR